MKNTTPNRVGGDSCCMRLSDEFLNSSNTQQQQQLGTQQLIVQFGLETVTKKPLFDMWLPNIMKDDHLGDEGNFCTEKLRKIWKIFCMPSNAHICAATTLALHVHGFCLGNSRSRSSIWISFPFTKLKCIVALSIVHICKCKSSTYQNWIGLLRDYKTATGTRLFFT